VTDEPSDGEIYAAYSRRFESPEVREIWLDVLRRWSREFPQELPNNQPNSGEGE
jgi:hypothetical protein